MVVTNIFTESGRTMGLGHLTRSIALYDELLSRGERAVLVINTDDDVSNTVKERATVIDKWYGKVAHYANDSTYSIIDSYIASQNDYEIISTRSKKALYIDDTNRLEYPNGLIVNPSIYGDQVGYNKRPGQTYLLGKDYVILREEFTAPFIRVTRQRIRDILITMGGSDIINVTPKIVEGLLREKEQNITLHVVIGEGFNNLIKTEAYGALNRVKFYYNLDAKQMRELMVECDLAITAAGQTTNELIAMQLPIICFKTADNQKYNILGLEKMGLIKGHLDLDAENYTVEQISKFLSEETHSIDRRKIIKVMKNIDIRNGNKNIINMLLC